MKLILLIQVLVRAPPSAMHHSSCAESQSHDSPGRSTPAALPDTVGRAPAEESLGRPRPRLAGTGTGSRPASLAKQSG